MKYDYDVIVIGGGAAGLTASGMCVSFGAKTLLIESDKLGGDCTWYGCIPSKTLLNASKIAYQMQKGLKMGITSGKLQIEANKIFELVRNIRQQIYEDADQPSIYEKLGMDVSIGFASFVDQHTISLKQDEDSGTITSRFFIVATGAKPFIPIIDGLANTPYLTNETIFDLSELPAKLAILGAGPIGIEMAQAFQRLGTSVSVIDMLPGILSKDDPELSESLKEVLASEGVQFYLDAKINKISYEDEKVTVQFNAGDEINSVTGDKLLIATGRRANVVTLNPAVAGIRFDKSGIKVDDRCRTNIKNIFACGDVTGRYQLTHMSDHMAKIAVSNALLKFPMKIDKRHVPWCTYTEPELAHVGATEKELIASGRSFKTYRFPFNKIDRAIADGETKGMIKVFAKPLNGRILGATILGVHAGELISEFAIAMKHGVTLRNMADTIHAYPTYALGNRRAADQWYVQRQSVTLVKWLKRIFGYRGPLPDVSDPDRIV